MLGILHDVSRCRGCLECVDACSEANDLGPQPQGARRSKDGLSSARLTALLPTKDGGRTVRRQCLHCLEPACVSACLVGALERTPEGRVIYDESRCIGCRYCMIACPFEIPRYEWGSKTPSMRKCEMCVSRPEGPACVSACAHDATEFGLREDLLRIARRRIARHPDRYVDRIYGEHEAGGTAVLYISDVPLDEFWPAELGNQSIPDLTWPLMSKTPAMAVGAASVVTGISWIVSRRMKLQAERASEEEGR